MPIKNVRCLCSILHVFYTVYLLMPPNCEPATHVMSWWYVNYFPNICICEEVSVVILYACIKCSITNCKSQKKKLGKSKPWTIFIYWVPYWNLWKWFWHIKWHQMYDIVIITRTHKSLLQWNFTMYIVDMGGGLKDTTLKKKKSDGHLGCESHQGHESCDSHESHESQSKISKKRK